ncbi:type III secretion protein [Burkholderia metallica]|uniref:type III secretion protein n=1 Tax=Burkholderia metallica TaxID=488729 RepID=UPI001CF4214C|nr:type III secretion protein [Burkholderia metallica]MCA8002720.1 type III secretion protein [Burkholderia metallica]
MSYLKRQIAVLQRGVSRRNRVEENLRAELTRQVAARTTLLDQESMARAHAQEIEAQAQSYRCRIHAMLAGAEPFTIDALTALRLYAQGIDEQLVAATSAASEARSALAAHDAEMNNIRQEIGRNRAKIDLSEARIGKLQRQLDMIAADAEDEDTEEAALARMAHR